MTPQWWDVLRPVPDDAIPEAREFMLRGTRLAAITVGVVTVVLSVALVAAGMAYPPRQFAVGSASIAGLAGLYALTRTSFGERNPEVVTLAAGLVSVVACLAGSWVSPDGVAALYDLVFVVVVVFSAFTPWRSAYVIALGTATWVLHTGYTAVFDPPDATDPLVGFGVALSATAIALLSAKLQRHVWASLHRASERAQAANRLSSAGRLAEGLAHEARTPLASALNDLTASRMLLDELEASTSHPAVTSSDLADIAREARECLVSATDAVERVSNLIGGLRSHAQDLRERPAVPFSVNDVLRATVADYAGQTIPRVRLDASAIVPDLYGDPDTLRRVLHHLIRNGVQAIAESGVGGHVAVWVEDHADEVVISVEDDGPGIPPGLEERAFEPMVTTRSHSAALGLGLPTARDLVEGVFSGHVELARARPGALFRVRLPRRIASRQGPVLDAHRPELGRAGSDRART